ncbi:hypothetical protein [Sphingomonas sp. PAMC 26621]|uniref:hypothetical protein n=1 Tax=Sphingomonas sp. PAMC 26621 TaxID=1112213 RepID=UPI0002897B11|nr:hypothetical protein [Sphingomonas sp. PAMC 26621]
MTRDPDLDLAIAELRPVFARMRAEKAKLRYERVRNDLNVQAAVKAYVRDLASEIGLRAERIGLDCDAFMAILAIDANEIKRSKINRKPSARQMTVALEAERKGRAEHVRVTEAALARADADYREALRLDAAARGACHAYTGYSG